jgi:hypothetical protein
MREPLLSASEVSCSTNRPTTRWAQASDAAVRQTSAITASRIVIEGSGGQKWVDRLRCVSVGLYTRTVTMLPNLASGFWVPAFAGVMEKRAGLVDHLPA